MIKHLKIFVKLTITICITIILACCSVWISRDKLTLLLFSDKGLAMAERFVNDSLQREVIIIPMSHLNTSGYYSKLREYLSNMRNQGYVTFNESVMSTDRYSDTMLYMNYSDASKLYSFKNAIDSLNVRKLQLKQRRMIGCTTMFGNDSLRYNNRSVSRALRDKKYLGQTSELLGINNVSDYWVDMTLADLIARYEADNGEIILSD